MTLPAIGTLTSRDREPSSPIAQEAGQSALRKFSDPDLTANGERRARVGFRAYDTLWFNTGTLCNIACRGCYIESSPKNDRLVYLSLPEVETFLDEAQRLSPPPTEIGFTGGEPFMNPEIIPMLEAALARGFHVLVLTNAMKPMQHLKSQLLDLNRSSQSLLSIRVSLDHYRCERHEEIRGPRTWEPSVDGLMWLAKNGFDIAVAGRMAWGEDEPSTRAGYAELFLKLDLPIAADAPQRLVLFPEMDERADVPEITEACWGILGKSPSDVMCSNSRMVIKRNGAELPTVVSCTLLAYSPEFEMGSTLAEAARPVSLNHRHCARFCVLGGATCSAAR
jgi:Radical SAM superfamily/4Fe-4S single cluster domain